MFISTSTNLTQRNLSNLPTYLPTYQPNKSFNLLIDFNQLHNWDDFQYRRHWRTQTYSILQPMKFNQWNSVKMKDLGEKKVSPYKLWQFVYYARFSEKLGQLPWLILVPILPPFFSPGVGSIVLKQVPRQLNLERGAPLRTLAVTIKTQLRTAVLQKKGYYMVPSRAWILPWLLQKAEIDRLLRTYSLHISSNEICQHTETRVAPLLVLTTGNNAVGLLTTANSWEHPTPDQSVFPAAACHATAVTQRP